MSDTTAAAAATDSSSALFSPTSLDAATSTPNYTKANLRQSQTISAVRSHPARTRARASSIAGANPLEASPGTSPAANATPSPVHPSAYKGRKRLSMNFALPVIASANGSTPSPTPRRSSGVHPSPLGTTPTHIKTQSVSHSSPTYSRGGPLPATSPGQASSSISPKHRQSFSVSFAPISSAGALAAAKSPPTARKSHNTKSKNLSNDSNSSSTSNTTTTPHNNNIKDSSTASTDDSADTTSSPSSKASTIEYYFSQLAYRERRVVELRDEIKRMELQLRQAEADLTDFRKQVPADLVPPMQQPQQQQQQPSPQQQDKQYSSGLSRSHTVSGISAEDSRARRLSLLHSPLTLMDSFATREEPRKHRVAASSSSISSAGSSILSNKTTRHSNSLSDSSNSSVEVLDEVKPMVVPSLRSSHSSHHGGHQYSQSYHQSSYTHQPHDSSLYQHDIPSEAAEDDMFHKGRRVVEEIGSQFWSFFEDIKNVTVGEEARDTLAHHQHLQLQQPERMSTLNVRKQAHRRFDEPQTEAVVTSIAGSTGGLQRRASSGVRSSMSMGNLNCMLEKDSGNHGHAGKSLRPVPEVNSNSYYIV